MFTARASVNEMMTTGVGGRKPTHIGIVPESVQV